MDEDFNTPVAIAEMLGGGKIMLIGNVIEMHFTKGQYYQGSGLALILTIFVLVSLSR